MNIFTITGFFLLFYAFIDYKRAFILFLVFRLFLNQNINLVNIPGIPLLTLEFALCFLFWCIYLIKRRELNIDKSPFPLKVAFIAVVLSYILSSVFGIAGFSNAFFNLLKIVIEDIISIWLIWVILKDKRDFIFLIKGVTIVFLFAGIYGIYEMATYTNPIMDYVATNAGNEEKVLIWNYTEEAERGYRIKSIFIHAIGAGMNWGLFFLVSFYLFIFYKKSIDLKYQYIIFVSILSIICLLFSNSRGPILFLMIGLIPFIKFQNRRNNIFLISGLVAVSCLFYYNESVFQNLISIFDKSVQREVGGSNFDMRLSQFAAAVKIMWDAPFFGIGLKGLNYYSNQNLAIQLLGLESMWFWIIVQQGILGIIATLYLIYNLVYKLGMKAKNTHVLFLSLAYFVTYSATSVPGFSLYLLYTFIFMFIKIKKWT
jgi:hypothetical protein